MDDDSRSFANDKRLLKPCPASPNCVNSQSGTGWNFVEPLRFEGDPAAAWSKAVAAVKTLGGAVEADDGGYLHAVFTSGFFRFRDDLELLLDRAAGAIHVRSASRVGNFDLGVNRRRVEKLRALYEAGGTDR